ncbi:hypothetical protein ABH940_006866 [Streptacidiphilus sp. BW17]|uniref:hypothetical protein n=1 Tax=Streptacidiphilus sp. BW17 TaxID=3156274 RepID=UPI003515D98F
MALTAEQEVEIDVLEARMAALQLLMRTQGRAGRHRDAARADLHRARLQWEHVLEPPPDGGAVDG